MSNRSVLSLLLAVVALSACDESKSPTAPVQPTGPTGPVVTETFSGSFGQLGRSCHQFSTAESANTQFSILSLAPVTTLTVGLGVGVVDAAADPPCAITASDTSVRSGEAFVSFLDPPGIYCTCIFDVGNVFPDTTVDYQIEVQHY